MALRAALILGGTTYLQKALRRRMRTLGNGSIGCGQVANVLVRVVWPAHRDQGCRTEPHVRPRPQRPHDRATTSAAGFTRVTHGTARLPASPIEGHQ